MAAVKDAEQHTPFCKRDCKLSHHELIKALFLFNNFSDGYSNPGHLHLFHESVQSCISHGWPKDSIVPDPSRDLQCPLVYLSCAFGKPKALALLLKMGFEPNICIRQTGETGLHAAVRYVYQSGAWSVNNGKKGVTKVRPKTRTSSFEKILESLSEKCPEILGQRDINWDTPLHIGAQELADTREQERGCTGKKLLMMLNNRKLHFEQCFKSMLAKVVQLQDQEVISAERAMQIICFKNRERKSVLNILSEGLSEKDGSLVFLNSVLAELNKRLSPNNVQKSGSETQMAADQGTLPSMVVMNPCYNTQSTSQAPLLCVQPQDKQPRKDPFNRSDRKHGTNSDGQQFIMSQSNTQGKDGESSVIHVVFGAGEKTVTKNTGQPSGGLPTYISHSQQPHTIAGDKTVTRNAGNSLGSLPTYISHSQQPHVIPESVTRKQPQRKQSRKKRKSSECAPQIDNICSTSTENQSIPPTTSTNVRSEESQLPKKFSDECVKNNESSSATISTPSEIHAAIGSKPNSSRNRLRKELRESFQASYSLEKECFNMESERLECLHGIKLRKEKIENLQKEIAELEQKAIQLSDSKIIVEKNWKAVQQREKEVRNLLFSRDPNSGNNVSESSKRLKLD